jgi:hypothetical protein
MAVAETGSWEKPCAVLLLCVLGWGCAGNPNVRVRRLEDGRLQVAGPWAGPFQNLETLATKACELVTRQPGASNGRYGSEYFALYYYSPRDKALFLSYLSDVRGSLDSSEQKSCTLPTALSDPAREDAILLGGTHSHPFNRQFSRKDLSETAHWQPTRFVDKATGQIWDRKLLMFFLEKTGECRVYSYNNFSRVIAALRDGQWVPIGKAYNAFGDFALDEGKDWVP